MQTCVNWMERVVEIAGQPRCPLTSQEHPEGPWASSLCGPLPGVLCSRPRALHTNGKEMERKGPPAFHDFSQDPVGLTACPQMALTGLGGQD